MSEWQEVSLGSVAQINPTESLPKGTLAKKIAMDALQPFTKRPSSFEVEPYNGGMKFKNGDTIVARITPCLENGKTAYIDLLDENEVAFGSTEYIVLREKLGVTDKQFLYYFSISPIFRDVAVASMTGSSGRQRVQTDVVKKHIFEMPSLEEQKAIASVLSSLDDKIDLLHRQNTTLERVAETLFRQWFVEEAQEDWEEKPLDKLVTITSSKRVFYSEYVTSGVPFYRSKEIIELHNSGSTNSELFITESRFNEINDKFGAPQESDILLTSVGTLGIPYKVKKSDRFYFKDGNLTWFKDFTGVPSVIIYCWLKSNIGKEQLDSITIGSTQAALTISGLKQIVFKLPPKDVIKMAEEKLTAVYSKIEGNQKQIFTLEKLRDNLLPKLMSGEIRVEH